MFECVFSGMFEVSFHLAGLNSVAKTLAIMFRVTSVVSNTTPRVSGIVNTEVATMLDILTMSIKSTTH